MINVIEKTLDDLRQNQPLILCLTNVVTIEFVANSLLALGAAPIMSMCEDELEELVKMTSAVYINMGTLDHQFMDLSKKALEFSKKYNKPIVFDPVGAGATVMRTEAAQHILHFSSIVRGNASEIMALGGHAQMTYGVESTHETEDAEEIASCLARQNKVSVIVSGAVDLITNGERVTKVPFGSALMQRVTGMGCSMTAVIAAFKAVVHDAFQAGHMATYYFSLCGQMAARHHQTPGAFKMAFLDQLYQPDFACMRDLYDQ